jgi:hypothetical protein
LIGLAPNQRRDLAGSAKKREPTNGNTTVRVVEQIEPWNEYTLEDGTVLRMKVVLVEVQRTSNYNAEGEPIYAIKSANILDAKVPPALKRKQS